MNFPATPHNYILLPLFRDSFIRQNVRNFFEYVPDLSLFDQENWHMQGGGVKSSRNFLRPVPALN